MKINKSSWHYRYMKWVDEKHGGLYGFPPKNLCQYFWMFVWALLKIPLLFVITGLIVGGFLYVLLLGFAWPFYTFEGLLIPQFISFVCVCIAMIGLLSNFIYMRSEESPDSVCSLAVNYLKAKKQKVCPIIKYENETEGE